MHCICLCVLTKSLTNNYLNMKTFVFVLAISCLCLSLVTALPVESKAVKKDEQEASPPPTPDSSSQEGDAPPPSDSSSEEGDAPPPSNSSSEESEAPPPSDSSSEESEAPPPSDSSSEEGDAPPPSNSSSEEGEAPPSSDSSSEEGDAPPPTDSSSEEGDAPPPTDSSSEEGDAPPPSNSSSEEGEAPPAEGKSDVSKKPATGSKRGSLVKRAKDNKSCKYNDKTIEHGKQAYEDVCGKLECQDGNLAWYYWPNADYFEECHVPPPLSHGHRQHNMNIPVHAHTHAIHAVGLPCDHGHLHLDPFCHSHPEPHLHIDPHHQHSMPVNVHIDHVHHPEHVEVPTLHQTTGHTIGHPMGTWGQGHAPYGLGF